MHLVTMKIHDTCVADTTILSNIALSRQDIMIIVQVFIIHASNVVLFSLIFYTET